MANAGKKPVEVDSTANGSGASGPGDGARKILFDIHAATQKRQILKPYVFQSLSPTLLPGVRDTS
eukprot:2100157-Pyramimonas_sp.AAC.1